MVQLVFYVPFTGFLFFPGTGGKKNKVFSMAGSADPSGQMGNIIYNDGRCFVYDSFHQCAGSGFRKFYIL